MYNIQRKHSLYRLGVDQLFEKFSVTKRLANGEHKIVYDSVSFVGSLALLLKRDDEREVTLHCHEVVRCVQLRF